MRQVERHARLRNPLRADVRVVVDAKPCVERQPRAERLPEIDVARHFVLRFVDLHLFVPVEEPVPRLAAEVEVVEARREPVTREELRALVPRYAQHPIARVEAVVQRCFARRITVVDLVPAPVIEETQGARGAVVTVLERERGHAARDTRIVVVERRVDRTRVRGVEAGQIHIAREVPRLRDPVSQLGIAAVLFETHIGTVAVGTVVGAGDDARETPLADAVREFGLQRVVGAVGGLQVSVHPFLALFARDDVDDASHRVGAVEHRSGTAQHLDALGQHRLVGVGDGVSHESHILRMAVDKHQQARGRQARLRCAADAAQRHAARRTRRDAVAHDTPRGGEKSRYLFCEDWQQRLPAAAFDLGTADHRDGHRQVADIGCVARARYDYLLDGVGGTLPHAVGPFGRKSGRSREQQSCRQYLSFDCFHFCSSINVRISGSASAAVAQFRQSVSTGHCPVRVRLTM